MLAIRGTAAVLAVEHDEDVEILWHDRRVYVQVKFRKHGLSTAEMAAIVERFSSYRVLHENGERSGAAIFVIATNAAPRVDESVLDALPADVNVSYPGHHDVADLPELQSDVDTVIAALEVEAANIPLAAISPRSLVLKLVGYANLLAMGLDEHRIDGVKITQICDLIVEQLQKFPEPPSPYRRQRDEPEIEDGARVRLITGFSGAGKTAWASRKATESMLPTAYFDVVGIPEPSFPGSLARELAAGFVDDPAQRAVVVVNQAGMDLLRAIARRVVANSAMPILVIDNAHLLTPSTLSAVVGALAPMRVVVLMQPGTHLTAFETRLSASAEQLAGWDDPTIALEFSENGARADVQTVARVRALTGALPLFVSAAAKLAARSFAGDPAAMCDALETGTMTETTRQNALLQEFVESLSADEQDTLAILGLSEVPLTRDEGLELLRSRIGDSSKAAAALRTLSSIHVLQAASGSSLQVHEAFRPIALEKFALLGAEPAAAARNMLRDIVTRGFKKSPDVERLRFWMKLSAQVGDIETLTDVALDEMVHQIGGPDIVRATLQSALDSTDLDASSRFDVLDALAFWDAQRGNGAKMAGFVAQMQTIGETFPMSPRQQASLAAKQMFLAADVGDRNALDAAFARGMAAADGDMDTTRNLRYNRAQGIVRMRDFREGGKAARELADEWLGELGLTRQSMLLKQPAELARRMRTYDSRDVDLRHAADALHVLSRTLRGTEKTMTLIQAIKLYSMARALLSVVRVSQDAVDAFLEHGDPFGARFMIEEHVLPDLRRSGLIDHFVDVQAQYGVVLAYAGAVNEGRGVLDGLRVYEVDPTMSAQLAHQRGLIEKIALTPLPTGDGQPRVRQVEKIGRNDLCPCGSGKKYKRCHGS